MDWVHFGDVDAATTGVLVTGLVNGTTYMLRVIAGNANGPGEPGEAKDTPRTVPGAPQSLLGAGTNVSGRIHLTWLAPAFDGGSPVTDYVIERSPHGANTWTTVADGVSVALSFDVDGLTPLASYDFRCFAVNDVGPGPASNLATAVPHGVPSAPRSLTAAPTNVSGQVRLTWVAPLSNGGVGGHRLHHPTFPQRHHRLDHDQRRRQHQHRRTPSPGWSTAPATTSGSSPTTPSATAPPATSPTPSRAPCRPPPVR